MDEKTTKGSCFCGAVEVTVTGDPEAMGFCHCTSCRTWSASPVNAFALWKTANVKITKGEGNLATYKKTDHSLRQFCKTCGGHVMAAHPPWDLVDVYAATVPTYPWKAGVHVHYQEKVLPMRDGLPKFRDIPKEMGGSGETLPE
jgi:hypothetical protein